MKVLSLFDGISCARVALDRAGIPVEAYYASEIDKYAMQISAKNWPDQINLGSVVHVGKRTVEGNGYMDLPYIDLLIGGSPCQDLSIAKKDRKGLEGDRSGLFWEYVRILDEVKPRYFVLENVASMPKEAKALITETLGVEPIMIDAALVSAQRRKRLFWVGKRVGDKYETVPVELPEDRGILLKDILEEGAPVKEKSNTMRLGGKGSLPGSGHDWDIIEMVPDGTLKVREATKKGYAIAKDGDAVDLSFPTSATRRGRVGNKAKNIMTSGTAIHAFTKGDIRKLTTLECERLQSLPDNYTEGVSNTQRYKACGNAFNVEVVAHILKNLI